MSIKDDLNYGLSAFGIELPGGIDLDAIATRLGEKPGRNTAALVALSAALFYAAERDHNPKVNDVFDALVYTSTCLSVGYGDIFAKTPMGKLLGSALMMYGPGLVAHTSDPDERRRDEVQEQILRTLQQLATR